MMNMMQNKMITVVYHIDKNDMIFDRFDIETGFQG